MRILGILSVLAAFAIAALENGLSKLPEPSGVTVTFDAAKPAGSRILEAKIGGAPIDPKAKYTLATADFLLNGGDGYTMLAKGEVVLAEGGLLDGQRRYGAGQKTRQHRPHHRRPHRARQVEWHRPAAAGARGARPPQQKSAGGQARAPRPYEMPSRTKRNCRRAGESPAAFAEAETIRCLRQRHHNRGAASPGLHVTAEAIV